MTNFYRNKNNDMILKFQYEIMKTTSKRDKSPTLDLLQSSNPFKTLTISAHLFSTLNMAIVLHIDARWVFAMREGARVTILAQW